MENPSKYLGNELENLEKVLEAESWSATGGSWNRGLEAKFAERHGATYGVAMNSGTATLHSALLACGVQPGDEVISPALTVIMDTTATLHANAVPVYADIDPRTFTIDPDDVAKKITSRTKAIIAVSLYGLPCDMDPLMELAREHGLALIEDNAQAVLSSYKGTLLGTIGDCSSYSFETTKHLSCGEGGMVLTNDEMLAERVRKIGGHGFKNLRGEEGRIRLNQAVFQDPDYKRHDTLGWNYRMPEFNAAIALAQLERIDELLALRIGSAAIFSEVMMATSLLEPQHVPQGYEHTYYTLAARYKGESLGGPDWREFRKAYIAEGGDGIYAAWSVPYMEPLMSSGEFVSHNPAVYDGLEYHEGICPVAEQVQQEIMQFKTNYRDLELARSKADALARTIERFS